MEQEQMSQSVEEIFEFLPKEEHQEHYELLLLVAGSQTEEEVASIVLSVKDQVVTFGGQITREENLGRRNLAYTVAGTQSGVYSLMEFDLVTLRLPELNEKLRIRKDITRFLIIKKRVKSEAELAEEERVRQKIDTRKKAKMQKDISALEDEATAERKPAAVRKETPAVTTSTSLPTPEATEEVKPAKSTKKKEASTLENIDQEIEKLLSDDIDV
ncbi:MAG: 30S ribosomal protein S6 [Candidatus Kerfeldbacteria bacterium]|nr:30S ribosomal protein S6 [Candidatus Kerfeldbacteria bacterium]